MTAPERLSLPARLIYAACCVLYFGFTVGAVVLLVWRPR